MIPINDRVALDETEFQFEFIRASGPGGQNVNKVSSAVRLRFDVIRSVSLPDDVRQRLIRLAGKKVGADGFLTLHARARRTQEANRREAIDRLVELVQKACERPRSRRETRPTLASRKRAAGDQAASWRGQGAPSFAGITRGIRANGKNTHWRGSLSVSRAEFRPGDLAVVPPPKHSKHNPD